MFTNYSHRYCPNATRVTSCHYYCWALHLISVACPVSDERCVVGIENLVKVSRCFSFDKHHPTLDGTLGLRITATCPCIPQALSCFGLFSTVSNEKYLWSQGTAEQPLYRNFESSVVCSSPGCFIVQISKEKFISPWIWRENERNCSANNRVF